METRVKICMLHVSELCLFYMSTIISFSPNFFSTASKVMKGLGLIVPAGHNASLPGMNSKENLLSNRHESKLFILNVDDPGPCSEHRRTSELS